MKMTAPEIEEMLDTLAQRVLKAEKELNETKSEIIKYENIVRERIKELLDSTATLIEKVGLK